MDIKDEDFSTVQDYFKDKSVENTRMAFKVRSKMVADIPCNFKNKYMRKGVDGIMCSYCKKEENSARAIVWSAQLGQISGKVRTLQTSWT